MKEGYCEKEEQVMAALQPSGSFSPDLAEHVGRCDVCSELMLVGEFLHAENALSEHELAAMPNAGLIWRKAQATAREDARKEALAKATRPIRFVRTCAYVIALFATPWIVLQWPQLLLWAGHVWPQALNETTLLLGVMGTLLCVGLSSWYMLREE
jgi:hypothetical protein